MLLERIHFDPILMVPTFVVRDDRLFSMLRRIDDLRVRSDTVRESLCRWAEKSLNTVIHERFHYWQGISLPFMQWYSVVALKSFSLCFSDLLRLKCNPKDWPTKVRTKSPLPLLTARHGYVVGQESIVRITATKRESAGWDGTRHVYFLSVRDLLESSASFAEWQAGAFAERNRRNAFESWCKTTPSYDYAYRIARNIVEDAELTFCCFLPVIWASFHTTDPPRAFVALMALIKRAWPPSESDTQLTADARPWRRRAYRLLSHIDYDAPADMTVDSQGVLTSEPFVRLTLETWASIRSGRVAGHPIVGKYVREFIALSARDDNLALITAGPAWMPEYIAHTAIEKFNPKVTIVRVYGGTSDENLAVMTTDELDCSDEWQPLIELVVPSGIVRRLVAGHYSESLRMCHHSQCDWYATNLCNSFPWFPENCQDCQFPAFIDAVGSRIRGEK